MTDTPIVRNSSSSGSGTGAGRALTAEAESPMTGQQQKSTQGRTYGLAAADSSHHAIASTLPAQFLLKAQHYTDPAWVALEQARIFSQTWLYVGDARQLKPGQIWVKAVAGQPMVITCTAAGEYQAFYNVCPHRAALLCPKEGIFPKEHLVCPYHAWVYNLQGELVGTPSKDRLPDDFKPQAYELTAVRIASWADFLFVCLGETAPDLKTFLAPIPIQVANHRQESTQLLFKQSRSVACNWKVYHDNTLCDYHVAIAHRTTLHQLQGPIKGYRHQFGAYTNLLHTPTLPAWRDRSSVLPNLPPFATNHFLTYGIFPNLHLLALPDGLLAWIRIDPVTVDRSDVVLEVYGPSEMLAEREAIQAEFNAFITEDEALVESVQLGYASGAYRPGPVSQLEHRIVHQQRLILQHLEPEAS